MASEARLPSPLARVSLTPHGWDLLERKLADWQALWEEACRSL